MLSLLRAELYRSLRDKRLYLLIAVTFVLFWFFWGLEPIHSLGWLRRSIRSSGFPLIAASHGWADLSSDPENIAAFFDYYIRFNISRRLFGGTIQPLLLSFYSAAILVGTRFTQRTIDIPVTRGVSRALVFLVSLIHFCLMNILILLLCLFGFLFLKFGTAWIPLFAPGFFLRCVGLWLWNILAYLMLTFAAAWVMKNVFGTMLVSAGLFLLEAIAAIVMRLIDSTPAIGIHQIGLSLRTFLPLWFIALDDLWLPETVLTQREGLLLFLIPMGYILCSVIVGWCCFRRRELN